MNSMKCRILFSFIIFLCMLTSCELKQKVAVKKLLKQTHEKELAFEVKELQKSIEEVSSFNKYENNQIIGRSDEWNEKIQPLMEHISEHHKRYHGQNSIIDNDNSFDDWTYFLSQAISMSSYASKISKKLYTCCPFCQDYWDLKTMYEYDFTKTTMYSDLIVPKIIREELVELNEVEFRSTYEDMKNLFEIGSAFTISEDIDTWSFSDEYKDILNKFFKLHNSYHKFTIEQNDEFLFLYKEQAIRRRYETTTPLPVISDCYTCCPWCRYYTDCKIEGKDSSKYYISDFAYLTELGLSEKVSSAKKEKFDEERKKYEADVLQYLKISPSTSIKGKLSVELKDNNKCPDKLFIPQTIDGIEVGDVYIREAKSLKAVYLPKSVEIVGLPMCYNLEKVSLNEGLKTIYFCGFLNCYKLKEIRIPDSVEIIGDFAFTNCVSLEKANLPKSLIYVGSRLFGFYWNGGFYNDTKRYSFGPKQEIIRKKLDLAIPEEFKSKNIVFGKTNFTNSFQIWMFAFTDTEDYLSISTKVRLRELGYTGKFNGEPEDAAM